MVCTQQAGGADRDGGLGWCQRQGCRGEQQSLAQRASVKDYFHGVPKGGVRESRPEVISKQISGHFAFF